MIKRLKWLGVIAAAVVLGGCAHPDFIKVGQPDLEVKAELGSPDGKLVNADGSYVLVYSDQPFGQEVWWMHFDQNGRFVKKEGALNEEHFKLVVPGKHTKADVFQMFGRCAQEYTFHLINEHAFMYRFEEAGGMDMAWWVQFNEQDIVTETAVTQDPWDRDFDPIWDI
ncbi:MAG: hypothetical protein IKV42_01450 [Burkholderiaceae bacterium]|nr:hypothetical protein [Burkholderiaceae bacterium]